MPYAAALCDVAALCRIDRIEMPDAFAVFRILPVCDIHAIPDDDRRSDQFVTGSRPDRVLRIRVELPQLRAVEVVASHPPIALRRDDLHDPPDPADRWRRPLPVQDAVLNRVVFPLELTALLRERDDRRSARRRDVDVAFILAIGRADEDEIPPDHR